MKTIAALCVLIASVTSTKLGALEADQFLMYSTNLAALNVEGTTEDDNEEFLWSMWISFNHMKSPSVQNCKEYSGI